MSDVGRIEFTDFTDGKYVSATEWNSNPMAVLNKFELAAPAPNKPRTIELRSIPLREAIAAAKALQSCHGSYAAGEFLSRLLLELSSAGAVELKER